MTRCTVSFVRSIDNERRGLCAFRGGRDNVSLPHKKVHRAVEMDATALFKNGARGRIGSVLQIYADGRMYMMRAFGRWERLGSSFLSHKCPAEASGHEVSHEGTMTWRGVEGLWRTGTQMFRQTFHSGQHKKKVICVSHLRVGGWLMMRVGSCGNSQNLRNFPCIYWWGGWARNTCRACCPVSCPHVCLPWPKCSAESTRFSHPPTLR